VRLKIKGIKQALNLDPAENSGISLPAAGRFIFEFSVRPTDFSKLNFTNKFY
jgi:hypothetical protein